MRRANLIAERARKGWTIAEAAERVGVSKNTYAAWELGHSAIRSDNLPRLSEVFDCTTDYLLGLSHERKSYSSA